MKNPGDYEVSFSQDLGWTLTRVGGSYSLSIQHEDACSLVWVIKTARENFLRSEPRRGVDQHTIHIRMCMVSTGEELTFVAQAALEAATKKAAEYGTFPGSHTRHLTINSFVM